MTNIYNIIAELCSHITGAFDDDSLFVSYSCISPAASEQIKCFISKKLPFLFIDRNSDGNLCIKQLDDSDLNDAFFHRLNAFIPELYISSDYFTMIGLLQIIDEGLCTMLKNKIKQLQEDDFSVVLNTNRESTGIGILPRCSCIWERKHRLSHTYNRLDNFLINILLLENSILGELIDKHFFLRHDFFPGFSENKGLRIAATPLRMERYFKSELFENNKIQFFRIIYNNSDHTDENELIWQKILLAAENNSDVIVFPELLGNPEMVDFISSRLRSLEKNFQKTIPPLIILPSVWNGKLNSVTILDNKGNVLCSQSKQNPFISNVGSSNALEAIASNQVVNIIHYEGIGRIAVLICKDLLATRYVEQLMRCFKLTLLFVPSFSTGSYDFRQSFDLCAHDDCNVVWINTCAAFVNGKEKNFESIGYVRKRVGQYDDDSQTLCEMPVCSSAFSGKCQHNCIYFETIKGV